MFDLQAVIARLQAQVAASTLPTPTDVGISMTLEPDRKKANSTVIRLFYGDMRSNLAEETTSHALGNWQSTPEFRLCELQIRIQCALADFPATVTLIDKALRGWTPNTIPPPMQDIGFNLLTGSPLAWQNNVLTYMLTYTLLTYT